MKKAISLFIIFFLIFTTTVSAQITGFVDDFNDNILTGWEVPANQPYTYELTEQNGVLQVTYHRVAQSWEWDNFNFIPPIINVANTPYISLEVKSNIGTEFTIKPIYQDGSSDWLPVNLPGDDLWHPYLFPLSPENSTLLKRIYFYLDGGTVQPKSGIVLFDNLKIGDSVNVDIVYFVELQKAIQAASALLASTVEGNEEGQFAPGSKMILQNEISAAELLLSNAEVTQQQVNDAVWDLYDACVNYEINVNSIKPGIFDSAATQKTRYLFANLDFLSADFLLFGMHDATGYGVGWSGDDDRSDVKDVCGSYPAVYSWDLQHVIQENELWRFNYRLTSAFERGGVQTLCWHQLDPQNRGFYARDVNNEKIVSTLLPGGQYHQFYKEKLRRAALEFKSLRGADGQSIPIIFRPYHENDGSWFWWGKAHCTREEFIQLWQFTAAFLRDSLNVHNLLYAYSPSQFNSENEYLDRYPGDEFIDILGMDFYFNSSISQSDRDRFLNRLQIVARLAQQRGKIPALTEVGQEALPTANWFTDVLLDPLKNDSLARQISYAAVWRNANENHHFAPYPGHPSVPDFIEFYNDPFTIFEDNLPDMYVSASLDSVPPVFVQFPDSEFIAVDTLVAIEIATNEKAFLRYSLNDVPYDEMENDFESGQGTIYHRTTFRGEQGQRYLLFVRAVDILGNETPDALQISFTVDTTQAPIFWHDLRYNDDDWGTGVAPLGFNSTQTTQVQQAQTVYFRKTFTVTDVDQITYLSAIVKYDNGAAVYLNGEEIGRINMPDSEINYSTFASGNQAGVKAVTLTSEQLSFLRNGENVLAVEMHQANGDESDMIFDLRLIDPNPVIEFASEWKYFDKGYLPPTQKKSTSVEIEKQQSEKKFSLRQNFPNPFNPTTEISFYLRKSSKVQIVIFNVLGEKIRTLFHGEKSTGWHRVSWDGKDESGNPAASGIYFYQLKTSEFRKTR
ncbi:MAG: T9SS type A sorting domain-containing protein, partial [Calditrichaeota bacterium]|nr:T9SS type A sorting domain-containing protein [Calditrichota bacterium]